jgi:hypothetical protein
MACERAGQTLDFVIGNETSTKARLIAAAKPTLASDALRQPYSHGVL